MGEAQFVDDDEPVALPSESLLKAALEANAASPLARDLLAAAWTGLQELPPYDACSKVLEEASRRSNSGELNPLAGYRATNELIPVLEELFPDHVEDIRYAQADDRSSMLDRPLGNAGLQVLLEASDPLDASQRVDALEQLVSWQSSRGAKFIEIDSHNVLRQRPEAWPFDGTSGSPLAASLNETLEALTWRDVIAALPSHAANQFISAMAQLPADPAVTRSKPRSFGLQQGERSLDASVFAFNQSLAAANANGLSVDPKARDEMRAALPRILMTVLGIQPPWQDTGFISFHGDNNRLVFNSKDWPFVVSALSSRDKSIAQLLRGVSPQRLEAAAMSVWEGEAGSLMAKHFAAVVYDKEIQLPTSMRIHRRAAPAIDSIDEVLTAAKESRSVFLQPNNAARDVPLSEVKMHVYCETFDDVQDATRRLMPVLADRGLTFKVMTPVGLERNQGSATQKNKGVTIYLPLENLDAEARRIAGALTGYQHADATIPGDHFYANGVSYRSTSNDEELYVDASVANPGPEALQPFVPSTNRDPSFAAQL